MPATISIIIVNYRSWERLDLCLDSIAAQEDIATEVIVVDNFSNDGKDKTFTAKYPAVHFIMQDFNGGFAQACNKGASAARGKWLLFLNPDTILNDGLLTKLITRVEHEPNWKIIGIQQFDDHGKLQHPFGNFLKWWTVWPPLRALERALRGKTNTKKWLATESVTHPDWISGSFILIRADDFNALGGWDQRFWMYSEDADLSRRAFERGWDRVMYNELSCVHAHGGSSRVNVATKALTKSEVIRSRYRYIDKHFSEPGRLVAKLSLILLTVVELILTAPFSAVRRKMVKNFLGKKAMKVNFVLT